MDNDFDCAPLPHHQPYILRGKVLLCLAAVFLILKLLESALLPQGETYASDLTTDNILIAINQQRSLRNLTILNYNDKLTVAAQSKADDMIARHYFSHTDPEGNYIWPKIVAAGYTPYTQLGENLAIEFYDTGSLIAAWMNSPTHRANILQENFRDQGMGLNFGDAALNQYHSAVVNTFGALAVAKSTPTAAINQPSAVLKSPSQTAAKTAAATPAQTLASKPAVKPPTATQTAVSTSTATPPVKAREQQSASEPDQEAQAAKTLDQHAAQPQSLAPAGAVARSHESQTTQPYEITHYLTLAFGLVLLVFLAADAKKIAETKLQALDKKLSNLMVLILSLVVIAFMYWL